MGALWGAIKTVTGGAVHVASAGWLCRVCGKPIETGSPDSSRCRDCVRKGKR